MTDRELLKMAAKAAGFVFDPTVMVTPPALWGCFETDNIQTMRPWNPLADDGDALRLAVQLELIVRCYGGSIIVDGGGIEVEEGALSNHYAATRRAIVRAAAEIGKAMP